MSPRIAFGGFLHGTNIFAPSRVDMEAFILVCAAPGPMPVDPPALPWKHPHPGIRTAPLGPVFRLTF
jgi:microcystin degradation protein MlrC